MTMLAGLWDGRLGLDRSEAVHVGASVRPVRFGLDCSLRPHPRCADRETGRGLVARLLAFMRWWPGGCRSSIGLWQQHAP
jgi:hypothetical protein